MRLAVATSVIALLFVGAASAQTTTQGSVKADLFPGVENKHTYEFNAIPLESLGELAERIGVTMLWDSPTAYVLIWVINVTDPTDLDIVLKLYGGHDRHAFAETYLAEGSYEMWVTGVVAATHYHLNMHYSGQRTPTRSYLTNITGARVGAGREALNLQLEEEMSSELERLRSALGQ